VAKLHRILHYWLADLQLAKLSVPNLAIKYAYFRR